jgi:alkanesulfonate monooxygenase SsuD/methylene tetrahydromethanopterin reductase-like flavin-dependent oxidoreductase (luciferase family)
MVAGAMPRWPELLAVARHAEAVGFDALWVSDHLGVLDDPLRPGDGPMGTWECWSVLAALAAVTTGIGLGSLVSCTAFRNPALLAKMAVTVDEVSGGRLTLGLGAGSQPEEFAAFGYPTDDAIGRFEEAVTIIGGLLHNGQIDFVGRHYQARECELRPSGPRPAGPPILIASRSPRMDRLAARHADGWNAAWPNRAQALAPRIAAIDAACRKVGRDPASLERSVGVMVDLPARGPSRTDRRLELAIELLERIGGSEPLDRASLHPLTGSAAEIAAELRACADLGITHAQIWLDPPDLAGVEAFAPILELLGPAAADAR